MRSTDALAAKLSPNRATGEKVREAEETDSATTEIRGATAEKEAVFGSVRQTAQVVKMHVEVARVALESSCR
jgi:hypothetical protein